MSVSRTIALLLPVVLASPVLAHHVSGNVYCDNDLTGDISGGDVRVNGVTMRATSTGPNASGVQYTATTPYGGTAGRYYIELFRGSNNYTLEIASGAPVGSTFISPAGGTTALVVTSGIPGSEAQVVDFLLGNCGSLNCGPTCDDNNPCTDDACGPNGCVHTNNTAACNDHNACTQTDQCSNGQCVGSNPVVCTAPDQCKEAGTCDPATGLCSHPAKPNGTSCNDDDKCTTPDTCTNGVCGGQATSCDDGNLCTTDTCHPKTGCAHGNNSAPCNDGNDCTVGDTCKGGQCTSGTPTNCDDHNPCTDDLCGPQGCVHTNNTAPCNDGNLCTTNDVCGGGLCAGTPKTCSSDFCNGQQTCDQATGQCVSGNGPPPFMVCSEARINNLAVINGSFAANAPDGSIKLSRTNFMPDGTTLTANTVDLGPNTSVCRVLGNDINPDADAEIRCGTGSATLPLMTPCCPIPAATCGGPDVFVGTDQVGAPLTPGSYGTLTMRKGASIAFKPGTYAFCEIDASQQALIVTEGTTTVHVTGDFKIGDVGYFGPETGNPLPVLNVGGTLVRVGQSALLRAQTSAPNAAGRLGHSSTTEGTFCANTIGTDHRITMSCTPEPQRPLTKKGRKRARRAALAKR